MIIEWNQCETMTAAWPSALACSVVPSLPRPVAQAMRWTLQMQREVETWRAYQHATGEGKLGDGLRSRVAGMTDPDGLNAPERLVLFLFSKLLRTPRDPNHDANRRERRHGVETLTAMERARRERAKARGEAAPSLSILRETGAAPATLLLTIAAILAPRAPQPRPSVAHNCTTEGRSSVLNHQTI